MSCPIKAQVREHRDDARLSVAGVVRCGVVWCGVVWWWWWWCVCGGGLSCSNHADDQARAGGVLLGIGVCEGGGISSSRTRSTALGGAGQPAPSSSSSWAGPPPPCHNCTGWENEVASYGVTPVLIVERAGGGSGAGVTPPVASLAPATVLTAVRLRRAAMVPVVGVDQARHRR